jgi:cation diffusion facilitator family transporter
MLTNLAGVRRVLWITLGLNALVAAAKLAYGVSHGLLAVTADGVHSVLDGSSNVIGLIAVAAAHRPPDHDHPYGHRKFETFAALAIGVLLALACWEIVREAWSRVSSGAPPGDVTLAGFVITGGTLITNAFVSAYEAREGRRLRSEILVADSAHTRSDMLVTTSVMLALLATRWGAPQVDIAVSVLIVAWIGRLAWKVSGPALSTLSDEARLDPHVIDDLAMSVDGVRDVHRIRTRGHLDAVFIDLHVQVDPSVTIERAHGIAHRVEQLLRERLPQVVDVVTHLEPHGDPVEDLDGSILGPPR